MSVAVSLHEVMRDNTASAPSLLPIRMRIFSWSNPSAFHVDLHAAMGQDLVRQDGGAWSSWEGSCFDQCEEGFCVPQTSPVGH